MKIGIKVGSFLIYKVLFYWMKSIFNKLTINATYEMKDDHLYIILLFISFFAFSIVPNLFLVLIN